MQERQRAYRAVIFDTGGLLFPSHFEIFAQYEQATELPAGILASVVTKNGEDGAWAALERGELGVDDFSEEFEYECHQARIKINARELMAEIAENMYPRPAVLTAMRRVRDAGFRTAVVTNNWVIGDETTGILLESLDLFDTVVESSLEGIRKPDSRMYALACARLAIAPEEIVCLDDLEVNLATAREMGMDVIHVQNAPDAIADLGAVLEVPVIP